MSRGACSLNNGSRGAWVCDLKGLEVASGNGREPQTRAADNFFEGGSGGASSEETPGAHSARTETLNPTPSQPGPIRTRRNRERALHTPPKANRGTGRQGSWRLCATGGSAPERH